MMNLGILAYASQTGLGYQTRDYVKHLRPAKILAVDLSSSNKMPIFPEWYSDNETIWSHGIPNNTDIDHFLYDLDAVLLAETPLNYYLFEEARRRNIRVYHAFNFEFLDYFNHPELPGPYKFIAPTVWNLNVVKDLPLVREGITKLEHLPVPVELRLQERQIIECKTIGHIIGRPAVHDRNGTLTFLDAIDKIEREFPDYFSYMIYYQEPQDVRAIEYFAPVKARIKECQEKYSRFIAIPDIQNNEYLFKFMDLLVLPRRYGGLCLPMQEALARGIPVLMTDVDPNNAILPEEWLIPSFNTGNFRGHADITIWSADAETLKERILFFKSPECIYNATKEAARVAQSLSWGNLISRYQECLSQ